MNIENYFESKDFIKALIPVKDILEANDVNRNFDLIKYLVNISIKYSILFGGEKGFSTLGLDDFIEKITKKISKMDLTRQIDFEHNRNLTKYACELCADSLLDKLNLTRQNLDDDATKTGVFSYIIKNLKGRRHKYHAFNSVNFDSIKENGINPNLNNPNQEEIDEIDTIFSSYGINMIFGWQKLNCEGKVSYSMTPSVSYYYGTNSPEWFSQFTGGAFAFNPRDKYKKDAFVRSDYNDARNNLIILMKKSKFSSNDANRVLDFFEKNWNIYANHNPMLAIVPEKNIEENTKIWTEILAKHFLYNDIDGLMDSCLFDNNEVDNQTNEVIDVTDAIFVKLPNYKRLIERVCIPQESQIELLEDEDSSIKDERTEEEIIYDKLMLLSQAKIKVRIDENGQPSRVSEHGEKELEIIENLLKDDDVFKAIVTDELETPFLSGWLNAFDKKVINKPENVKLLALYKPTYFYCVADEVKKDINLMRECATQKGTQPILTCYVGENVQNDFEFISGLIINSNEKTFDFVGRSTESLKDSNMRYGKSIGYSIRSNPYFWQLLNSKIASINENSPRYIPNLDIEKELALVNNSATLKPAVNVPSNQAEVHKYH